MLGDQIAETRPDPPSESGAMPATLQNENPGAPNSTYCEQNSVLRPVSKFKRHTLRHHRLDSPIPTPGSKVLGYFPEFPLHPNPVHLKLPLPVHKQAGVWG